MAIGLMGIVMKLKRYLQYVNFVALLIFGYSMQSLAAVSSITEEVFEQRSGDAFWVIEFSCEGASNTLSIEQKVSDDKWCVVGVNPELCGENKRDLANDVCDSDFIQASVNGSIVSEPAAVVSTTNTAPAAVPVESTSNQQAQREQQQREQEQREQEQARARLITEQNNLQKQLDDLEQERNGLRRAEFELEEKEAQIQKELELLSN